MKPAKDGLASSLNIVIITIIYLIFNYVISEYSLTHSPLLTSSIKDPDWKKTFTTTGNFNPIIGTELNLP